MSPSRHFLPILLLFLLSMSLSTKTVFAQEERPKVGLALSGGGAKGLAHLGVIQVLEEEGIEIDYIAGTSMGAVVGGLYAVGYNADSLIKIMHSIPWNKMYFDNVDRTQEFFDQKRNSERFIFQLPIRDGGIALPDGLIAGQRFFNELNTYTLPVHDAENDFEKLKIPFRAVATNLENGEAYVFQNGSLSMAIRASMSIPSILKPLKFDETKLIDGGIARNIPAIDVLNMGADYVIGVDVGQPLKEASELNSLVEIMDQAVSFQIINATKQQRKLCDVVAFPSIEGVSANDFDKLDSLIYRGRQAAYKILPQIERALNTESQFSTQPVPSIAIPDKYNRFTIVDLNLDGVNSSQKEQIEYFLDIELGKNYTLKNLQNKVDQIYATGLFELITFNVSPIDESSQAEYLLTLTFVHKSEDSFGIGLRYNDFQKAAFLFNLTLRDSFINSSLFSIDLRAGSEYMVDVIYQKFRLMRPRLLSRIRSRYIRTSLPRFEGQNTIAELSVDAINLQLELGSMFTRSTSLTLFGKAELYQVRPKVAPASFTTKTKRMITAGANIDFDNLNSKSFTKSGQLLKIRGEISDKLFLSDHSFIQLFGEYHNHIPIHPDWTISAAAKIGFTDSDDLPVHYQFQFGGLTTSDILLWREHPFWGYDNRSVSNNSFKIFDAGVQYEIFENRFLSFNVNAGTYNPLFNLNMLQDEFKTGWKLTVGTETGIGPFEISIAGGSQKAFMTGLNFGYKF